jgi:hypothetical protein
VDASGSAGFDSPIGGADVSGSAGVSVGAQVGVEGSAHATFKDNTISIGVDGQAACLIGLDADFDLDIDIGPIVDTANMMAELGKNPQEVTNYVLGELDKATKEAQQTAADALKVANDAAQVADQTYQGAKQVTKDAEKTANDAASAVTGAANDVANWTQKAFSAKSMEKAANDTINACNSAIATCNNTINTAAKSISDAANSAVNATVNVAKNTGKSIKKFFSDSRLKENVKFAGTVAGLNTYTYNYIGDATLHTGVMAQEILTTEYANAVSVHESGYYQVDYAMLPVTAQDPEQPKIQPYKPTVPLAPKPGK